MRGLSMVELKSKTSFSCRRKNGFLRKLLFWFPAFSRGHSGHQWTTRNRAPTHYTQEIDQRYSKEQSCYFFFFHSYLFIGSPLLFARDIIRTLSKYHIPIELWAVSYLRVSTSQVEPVLESIWNSTHSSQMVENETRHQLNRNGNSTVEVSMSAHGNRFKVKQ